MPRTEIKIQPDKILYECGKTKCKLCSYPICQHTSDITHAKNFHRVDVDGKIIYMEVPR